MPAIHSNKLLSVRLPEVEIRKFKTLAVSRGVSMQEAIHQAMESWASKVQLEQFDPLDALQGSLAHVDVDSLRRQERETERAKDERWS